MPGVSQNIADLLDYLARNRALEQSGRQQMWGGITSGIGQIAQGVGGYFAGRQREKAEESATQALNEMLAQAEPQLVNYNEARTMPLPGLPGVGYSYSGALEPGTPPDPNRIAALGLTKNLPKDRAEMFGELAKDIRSEREMADYRRAQAALSGARAATEEARLPLTLDDLQAKIDKALADAGYTEARTTDIEATRPGRIARTGAETKYTTERTKDIASTRPSRIAKNLKGPAPSGRQLQEQRDVDEANKINTVIKSFGLKPGQRMTPLQWRRVDGHMKAMTASARAATLDILDSYRPLDEYTIKE